ncbi:MAG: hypothetical protein AB8B65_10215 [Kordia sp.]|uniref:hypothetical protein n=1 Tax=Kordia sp. TaxID=1965332 RepID=UPI00385B289F
MKPFTYISIVFLLISCSSISTPCYMGVLPFNERARLNDSLNLKLEKVHQKKQLTETENTAQLNLLKSDASIAEKLVAIKNEIQTAASYNFPRRRIKSDNNREYVSFPVECEMIFRLSVKDVVYELNYKLTQNLDKKLQLLTAKNIDSMTVVEGITATALFGSNGSCGVVILHSNNRKLKRKLRKL